MTRVVKFIARKKKNKKQPNNNNNNENRRLFSLVNITRLIKTNNNKYSIVTDDAGDVAKRTKPRGTRCTINGNYV